MVIKIIEKYGALIASWKIVEYDQDGPNLRLKAEFEFTDGSRLFVRQIVQALLGQDITVFGDGSQTRSFCYVDDLIEGMMRMMGGPDAFIGPVNLEHCSGHIGRTSHPEMTIKPSGLQYHGKKD